MSLNVLKVAHELKLDKLVTIGTVCSYPKNTPVPFKEEDLWNGYPEETNAPYGLAKKNLLIGCQAFANQYGSNFIHLIPVNMYGEHDHFSLEDSHVIPAMIRKIYEAKNNNDNVIMWGDGSPLREFTYVDDICRISLLLLEKYDNPEPINVGTTGERTIKIISSKIANYLILKAMLFGTLQSRKDNIESHLIILGYWSLAGKKKIILILIRRFTKPANGLKIAIQT